MPQALQLCNSKDFEIKDLFVELAQQTPQVPYAFLVGKVDEVQRKFFNALKRASDAQQGRLQHQEEVDRYFRIIGELSRRLPNVVSYFVNGDGHVFTNRDHYFTADATGTSGNETFRGPSLKAWVERLPLLPGERIRSVCQGQLRAQIPARGNASGAEELRYCYAAAAEQEFVQPAPSPAAP